MSKFLYKLQSEEQQLTVKASSSASAQPKLRSFRRCEYYSKGPIRPQLTMTFRCTTCHGKEQHQLSLTSQCVFA
ncbi:hypothetical protein T01_7448 [Trichinella spiralis]|uniref:Uncharacterized protein n=1 Tax=Trichinella spiralis TaxID=6334 RepID=A0A0V1AZK4_TRISP|nr:hypothetical protein T01_7448 [Trichinella spiralis]